MHYEFDHERVRAWTSPTTFWETSKWGDGLFYVDLEKNSRKQKLGCCDFNVRGILPESKKAKMRRAIKTYTAPLY